MRWFRRAEKDRSAAPDSTGGTLRRVLQNAGWLLAGKGVGAVLSLIYIALATRMLGAQGFGQFALILGAAQTLAAFVGFQTWQLVVRFGMQKLHDAQTDELGDLLAFALALDVGAALLGCLVAAAGVGAFGSYFGWPPHLQREALAFAIILLLSVRSTPTGILRLHDRFRTAAMADAVTPIVRMIGALVAVAAGASITGFLFAWAAAEIATASVYWFLASRVVGKAPWQLPFRGIGRAPAANPGLIRFAIVTNGNYSLNSVAKQASTVAVGFFAGPVAAGHYRLAYQLGQALAKFSDLFARAVFAEMARVHVSQVGANLRALFKNAVAFSAASGVAIIIVLFAIGKPALELIAGPEYLPAFPLLLLLGTAAALDVAGVSFEPTLIATRNEWLALRLRIISTVALVIAMAVLLPLKAEIGAGIATLGASVLGLILFGLVSWNIVHREARSA